MGRNGRVTVREEWQGGEEWQGDSRGGMAG